MVSTACIAGIGIMSAAVVLVTASNHTTFWRWYRGSGALAHYVFYYLFTIACLFTTHTLCLWSLESGAVFEWMLASFLTCTLQILFVIFMAHYLVSKNESHDG